MPAIALAPSIISTLSRISSKSNNNNDTTKHLRTSVSESSPSSLTCVSRSLSTLSSPAGQGKKLALETIDVPRSLQRQLSQSSSASSSPLSSQATGWGPKAGSDRLADRLSVVLADDLRVRRSRCAPDFLEEVAKGGPSAFEALCKDLGGRFRVVTGAEAVGVYKSFVGNDSKVEEEMKVQVQPLVFAVSVCDAGRKLVDYYMTWKGKTRANSVKERRNDFLDSEFRKVARSIDKEFRRTSIYGSPVTLSIAYPDSAASLKGTAEAEEPAATAQEAMPTSRRESMTATPANVEHLIARPPSLSSSESVMSLPYLNMIRNVPVGNRLPLRVTNPDRSSILSNGISVPSQKVEAIVSQKPVANLPTVQENVEENQFREDAALPTAVASLSKTAVSVAASIASVGAVESKISKRLSVSSSATLKGKRRNSSRGSATRTEFVIALLDEKLMDQKSDIISSTWHGLERQVSRKSASSAPRRVSPWDGPLARDNGITYRTRPIRPSEYDDSSSSEEEWENAPVVPMQAFVMTSFAPSSSSSKVSLSEPCSPLHKPQKPSPFLPTSPPYPLGSALPSISLSGSAALPYSSPHAVATVYPRFVPRLQTTHSSALYNAARYADSVSSVSSVASSYHSPVPVLKPLQRASYVGHPVGYLS